MNRRVVITGMGVTAPNGVGLDRFEAALRAGTTGIRFNQELKEKGFTCQVAGWPEIPDDLVEQNFPSYERRGLNSSGIIYGVIAGMEAWNRAGLPAEQRAAADPDAGIIFGAGISGVDKFREAIHLIDQGKTRRLGSTSVLQTMTSGISAYLNRRLGCGNIVTSNSSACTTGTESVLLAFDRIQSGKAKRMLAGSCGDSGPYIWGGFDAMRILPYQYNQKPEAASRPFSATAAGFVPGSGAGALVLEDLDAARKRGATIYAEILGGFVNSGGQREGGSMTAPNPEGVKQCIESALTDAKIVKGDINAINGHMTATAMDPAEIKNWVQVLGRGGNDFPYINSLKGLVGHCLGAAGSIECVASVLQVHKNFIFGNRNCGDLHPEIEALVDRKRIPQRTLEKSVSTVVKASFGFGDVNAVIIFGKHRE